MERLNHIGSANHLSDFFRIFEKSGEVFPIFTPTAGRTCSDNTFAGTWENDNGRESGTWAGTKQ